MGASDHPVSGVSRAWKLMLGDGNCPRMRSPKKIFLVWLCGSMLLLTGFGGVFFSRPKLKVDKGAQLFQKNVFFENAELGGWIASITWGRLSRDPEAKIVVTGRRGAAFVTAEGILRSLVQFAAGERGAGRVIPVDVENDGLCEFMDNDGSGFLVSLFDHQGRRLWQYPPVQRLDQGPIDITAGVPSRMAAGDLDADNTLDFVVGMVGEGSRGIHRLDAKGRVQWIHEANWPFHVEIVDTNNDGRPEIVYSSGGAPWSASAGIFILDADGHIIRRIVKGGIFGVGSFSLCRWRTTESRYYILKRSPRRFQLLNFSGEVIAQFPVSNGEIRAQGTPVQFESKDRPFFALMTSFLATKGRSVLYIYNSEQKLIYKETLSATLPCLTAVPDRATGGEVLLVGLDDGKVWRYRLKPSAP